MKKKLSLFILSPVFLSIIVFLVFQLSVFNLGISYRDEGFFAYSAIRIMKGEIPYRDFFLTTTPGAYYLNAVLFKIFGVFLIVPRIAYIVFSVLIIFLAGKIFSLKKPWSYLYFVLLSASFVWPGGFIYYNTESFLCTISGLYFLKKSLAENKHSLLILSGLFTAASIFFKQTIGVFSLIAFMVILGILNSKNRWQKITIFLVGFAFLLLIFLFYLLVNQSLSLFLYYTFTFAKIVKAHRSLFLIQRMIFIPIFFLILKFLFCRQIAKKKKITTLFLTGFLLLAIYFFYLPSRLNVLLSHLTDPLFYFYTFAFFFPLTVLFFSSNSTDKARDLNMSAVVSLALFLALGSSGYEIGVIKNLTFFLIPLVIEFSICGENLPRFFLRINNLLVLSFIISYSLFIFTNPFSAKTKVFGIYPKAGLKEILDFPTAKYIKVSLEEKKDLEDLSSLIKPAGKSSEKIFCFPYCPMIFVLTGKDNPSYFSLFYFETFMANHQPQVIEEIKTQRPAFIIVQKPGYIEPEADFEDQRLSLLKNFLFKNFKKTFENNSFIVLDGKN